MDKYSTKYYNGYRYYVNNETGKKVPSVTSITSIVSPFNKSKPGDSAKQGSLLHYHLEKQFCREMNLEPPRMPRDLIWSIPNAHNNVIAGLQMFSDLGESIKLDKIMGIEDIIFNEDYGFAGRVDRWGIREGRVILDEYKSGDWYPHYALQGAAYAKTLNADLVRFVMLDLNIKRNPESKGKLVIMDKKCIDKYFNEFLDVLEKFNDIKRVK
jgi:hypothetical protein